MIKVLIHSQIHGEMYLLKENMSETEAFVASAKESLHYGDESQCQFELVDVSAEMEQEKINAEALKYLADTDWLLIRSMETGIPMPEEVKAKRAEARLKIVK